MVNLPADDFANLANYFNVPSPTAMPSFSPMVWGVPLTEIRNLHIHQQCNHRSACLSQNLHSILIKSLECSVLIQLFRSWHHRKATALLAEASIVRTLVGGALVEAPLITAISRISANGRNHLQNWDKFQTFKETSWQKYAVNKCKQINRESPGSTRAMGQVLKITNF